MSPPASKSRAAAKQKAASKPRATKTVPTVAAPQPPVAEVSETIAPPVTIIPDLGARLPTGGHDIRVVATGMLVAMAVIYVAARYWEPIHPVVGFVRAFAEAAMVGGLADWFAVTALFRHPMGLPIPHTAIIPRNKDRIGETLAQFIRDNFLIPRVIARRMRRFDVAGAAGRFLSSPAGGAGRMRAGASRLIADVLGALDPERLGGMVKSAIADRLRALDIAPLLGQALEAAMAQGRHQPVLDGLVSWAAKALDANAHLIHDMVHERANTLLRLTGLDETLANSIVTGLNRMLTEMAEDPDHPLRIRAEEGLASLAHKLQNDPRTKARVAELRDHMIDNPAIKAWLDGLWEQARTGLMKAARDPETVLAGRLGEALKQLGTTLIEDEALKATINRFARRAAAGAAASYGDTAVSLISETVRGWDAQTVTDRLENAVGRDLQYIRINGTIVGGLVGMTIHAADVLFF